MEILFERHDAYLSNVPMAYCRNLMKEIDWDARLVMIKGPKGVGKTTMLHQYIKKNFDVADRHVLYCSADTSYFATHTLAETADRFVKLGGKYLFIDEVHKYKDWSREIKEIYDLYRDLHVVLSGSSLIQMNDGHADLSRRILEYDMPGLSYREFLRMDKGFEIEPLSLQSLLDSPNAYCNYVCTICRPLEHFRDYLRYGFYPFYFEGKSSFYNRLENVINYMVDVELTKYRGIEVGNTRRLKALLQVITQMAPYEVDIAKLSRTIGISRPTIMRYLSHLDEAKLIRRLFTDLRNIGDLQKPDKIYLDNTNLLYALSNTSPDVGTVRETFFASMAAASKHVVEYAGYRKGDFRIDGDIVIEVGGADKGFSQIAGHRNAYVAADDVETAAFNKIPLWAFGFLY